MFQKWGWENLGPSWDILGRLGVICYGAFRGHRGNYPDLSSIDGFSSMDDLEDFTRLEG